MGRSGRRGGSNRQLLLPEGNSNLNDSSAMNVKTRLLGQLNVGDVECSIYTSPLSFLLFYSDEYQIWELTHPDLSAFKLIHGVSFHAMHLRNIPKRCSFLEESANHRCTET